jgi:hypothetical protein
MVKRCAFGARRGSEDAVVAFSSEDRDVFDFDCRGDRGSELLLIKTEESVLAEILVAIRRIIVDWDF